MEWLRNHCADTSLQRQVCALSVHLERVCCFTNTTRLLNSHTLGVFLLFSVLLMSSHCCALKNLGIHNKVPWTGLWARNPRPKLWTISWWGPLPYIMRLIPSWTVVNWLLWTWNASMISNHYFHVQRPFVQSNIWILLKGEKKISWDLYGNRWWFLISKALKCKTLKTKQGQTMHSNNLVHEKYDLCFASWRLKFNHWYYIIL